MTHSASVVPAYEEADGLGDTLESLAGQDAEVVVAAGEDTIRVADVHDAADVVVEDEREDGPGVARNEGARAASGDVLLFTDADTQVHEGWVTAHLRHYDDLDVVGTGGPLRPLEGGRKHRLLFKLLSDWWYRISWPVGFVQQSGNNAGYRREERLAAGGFDEEIPFIEDTELSMRMKSYGRAVYNPDCWVETSVRRQQRTGYAGLFTTYLSGYLDLFVLGRDTSRGYFRDR